MGLRDMMETPPGGDPQRAAPAAGQNEPAPDVSESGTEASMDVEVHVAWSRVMLDCEWLGKERRTTDGARFNYRGIDDVINLVGPALRKHGVFVVPIGSAPTYTVINTKSGSAMNYCRTVSRFQVFGPRGDSFIGETPGEGFDSGDKSSSKAQSVAYRTFLIEALALATERPQLDPEYGPQHEIAGPRQPTAAEYHAEIVSDATSISRLQQIKAELDGNPAMGRTEVEGLDGKKVTLGQLVRHVGRRRLRKPPQQEDES